MKATGYLLAQQGSVARPAVRLCHRVIIVFDEPQDAVLQIVKRTERSVAGELLSQRPEPDLNLIQPAAMLRCVDEANAMTLVAQEFTA